MSAVQLSLLVQAVGEKKAALMTTPPDRRDSNGSAQSRDEAGKMLPALDADSGTKFGKRDAAEEKQEQIHRAILRAPSEAQRLVPGSLESYAMPMCTTVGDVCRRCFTRARIWLTRVYGDLREVRLCVDCWKAWGAR